MKRIFLYARACGARLSTQGSIAFLVLVCCTLLSCEEKKPEPALVQPKKDSAKELSVEKRMAKFDSISSKVPKMGGRCVCVSLCGVDSRLNDGIKHADANHVIKFWLDSGAVEIIDIPRDTRMQCGLDSNLNILSNLRAHRGRKVYLDSIARVTRSRKMDYYCELGFSQATGMLELLGHKDDATQTLRALRSRQGFDAGDFQRCYNQGVFLSQVLTRHFSKATGWFRDPLLRAALLLVDTNMPLDTIKSIIDQLEAKGFPENKRCYVHIMPNFGYHLPTYDFESPEHIKEINDKIDARIARAGVKTGAPTPQDYESQLESLLQRAAADTAKSPRRTIQSLSRAYEQRSWMQVADKTRRADYVQRLCKLLIVAHTKCGQKEEALKVTAFYEQHRELFE